MNIKCIRCGIVDAIWFYCGNPEEGFCDDCVSRHPCSCNLIEEKEEYRRDKDGNILPEEYYRDGKDRFIPCADYVCFETGWDPEYTFEELMDKNYEKVEWPPKDEN